MSKILDIVAEELKSGDEIECAFPSMHEGGRGYIVLSEKKMFFIEEEHLIHRLGHLFFEIPLWAINSIEVYQDQFVTTLNDGDKYSFESIFSNEVKAEFEKLVKNQKQTEDITPETPNLVAQ
ncbi:MAG: hypothetical protein QG670_2556 [Thermoproteota archaeon]|nr:hypothetical protein [Thermoproteota archaeon]